MRRERRKRPRKDPAIERIERAEKIARQVWRRIGVKPDDSALAKSVLMVLEDMRRADKEDTDGA